MDVITKYKYYILILFIGIIIYLSNNYGINSVEQFINKKLELFDILYFIEKKTKECI